jgi:methionyl-tRNA formyltransferase
VGELARVPVHPRRLIFLGTPDLAVPPLEALVAAGFEVVHVVTRPDTRRGRGAAASPSPVKVAAERFGLPVSHTVEEAVALGPELGVVVAYGRIIKRAALEAVPMINLHFSLLPRWRGAAPVERALLAGDAVTGVQVMQVEEGLDTGPVYASRTVPIGPRATLAGLRAELVDVGTELLVETLRAGLRDPVAQAGDESYATKLDPAELELRWSEPAEALDRIVRVGGAWTSLHGRRLKVLAAEPAPTTDAARAWAPGERHGVHVGTGDGVLRLVTVQPEGKPAMAATAWANGSRATDGERLG